MLTHGSAADAAADVPESVRTLQAKMDEEWDPVLQSARQTAAVRALWGHVVRDPVASVLAGDKFLRSLRDKMDNDRRSGAAEVSGVMLAVRTLWFDARIEAAVGAGAQVVLLGAGMDARAYRLGCLKNSTVFEVDFPELLQLKAHILHEATTSADRLKLSMAAASLTRVAADIRDGSWFSKLTSAGFSPEKSTVWVLEGILYYLPHAPAMQVLETIAGAGGVLLADFMNKAAVALSSSLYQFNCDWPDLLLPSVGFSGGVSLSQVGDPDARFGLLPDPRNLFDKLRRLPRSTETDPDDGTPCCRLYLVQASVTREKN